MKLPTRARRSPAAAAPLAFCLWLLVAALPAPPCRAQGAASVPVYTLDDCLALANKQNPDILQAAKRVDAARASITTAKAGIYPTLSSFGYYQYREQSLTTENGQAPTNRKEDYVADARVTQNLYSAGAVRNRIAGAKILADVESLAFRAQLDTTDLAVRTAFYQTLYAEGSIEVRRQAVDLLAAQLKDQRDRFAAGSVGQINVNRAQVSLANEQPALIQAQAGLRTAYVNLAQVLAVAYPADANRQPFRVRGTLDTPAMSMTLAECLERAKALRPEIQARKLAIDALHKQLIVEKAATRPQISAFAAYDVYSEPSILSTRDYFSGYTLGVSATWTIFDGFATRGRVRNVQAQTAGAEAQLEGIRQQVEAEVRTAFYDLQQAAETLRPQTENIRLATETLNLTTRNFDAGLNNQLDVFQTRVDLTRAQVTELSGRLAYRTALARLERAMGVGHQPLGTSTARTATNK